VLQRVQRAEVRTRGKPHQQIAQGLVLLVGLEDGDTHEQMVWMANKIAGLRVFRDQQGHMNLSLDDVDGRCLVVSQFTLLADCQKGRRPSFVHALQPLLAEPLFLDFCELLEERTGTLARGTFGAHMEVELVNDGPVTLVLERRAQQK